MVGSPRYSGLLVAQTLSPDIFATLTLGDDGTLIFTPVWNAVGHGTWAADDDGRIELDISWLYTSDYSQGLDPQGGAEATASTIYLALANLRISFNLARDGQSWEDQTQTFELLVRDNEHAFGSGEPTLFRITDLPAEMAGMDDGFDARRLDQVIHEAPGMTRAEAGLATSSADDIPIAGSPLPPTLSTPTLASPVEPIATTTGTQSGSPTPTRNL